MNQYLVTIRLPDNFKPSAADEAGMGRDIDTPNEEMAGWRRTEFCELLCWWPIFSALRHRTAA
jgi:hypothetical protein